MHCYYVNNFLMLNCKNHCRRYRTKIEALYWVMTMYDYISNMHFSYGNCCVLFINSYDFVLKTTCQIVA